MHRLPSWTPTNPLCSPGNLTCFNPGNCPYGGEGVLLVVLGAILIALGIAIGYADWEKVASQGRSQREPLEEVVTWYGFE